MNWTGGKLQQSKRSGLTITAKQRSYFARARAQPLNGENPPVPEFDLAIYDLGNAKSHSLRRARPREGNIPLPIPNDQVLSVGHRLSLSNVSQIPKMIANRKRKAVPVFDLSTEEGLRGKRLELAARKNWFEGPTIKPLIITFPSTKQIGWRRKLTEEEKERYKSRVEGRIDANTDAQDRYNTRNSVDSDRFQPDDVSVRVGDSIHGSQRARIVPAIPIHSTTSSNIGGKPMFKLVSSQDLSDPMLDDDSMRSSHIHLKRHSVLSPGNTHSSTSSDPMLLESGMACYERSHVANSSESSWAGIADTDEEDWRGLMGIPNHTHGVTGSDGPREMSLEHDLQDRSITDERKGTLTSSTQTEPSSLLEDANHRNCIEEGHNLTEEQTATQEPTGDRNSTSIGIELDNDSCVIEDEPKDEDEVWRRFVFGDAEKEDAEDESANDRDGRSTNSVAAQISETIGLRLSSNSSISTDELARAHFLSSPPARVQGFPSPRRIVFAPPVPFRNAESPTKPPYNGQNFSSSPLGLSDGPRRRRIRLTRRRQSAMAYVPPSSEGDDEIED